jgi:ribonuclease HI
MNLQKYYTVWAGRRTGVFSSWKQCQHQILGFKGARFKSFQTLTEAKAALNRRYQDHRNWERSPIQILFESDDTRPITNSITVSGTCNIATGEVEIQAVHTGSKHLVFWKGPYHDGTGDMAEFIAIVQTLKYLKLRKLSILIYSESSTAIKWITNRSVTTKLPRRASNRELYDLFDSCLAWLNDNTYYNRILKWNTQEWGRNPAGLR